MGHNSVVSNYMISTNFPWVDVLSTNPWMSGVTVTPFIEILVSSQFFNRKFFNIVIFDHVFINPHVYNLIS